VRCETALDVEHEHPGGRRHDGVAVESQAAPNIGIADRRVEHLTGAVSGRVPSRSDLACAAVEITDDERDLLLAGLFELWITHGENDLKAARIKALHSHAHASIFFTVTSM
jgi:hypothetical protein